MVDSCNDFGTYFGRKNVFHDVFFVVVKVKMNRAIGDTKKKKMCAFLCWFIWQIEFFQR